MSETEDPKKKDDAPKEAPATEAKDGNTGAAPQQAQATMTINESDVRASYANFCRVSSTPEELILDMGLNPNPFSGDATINISERIILNHYTAKRLLNALSMALQRHEQVFGVLETDIHKRVKTPTST